VIPLEYNVTARVIDVSGGFGCFLTLRKRKGTSQVLGWPKIVYGTP